MAGTLARRRRHGTSIIVDFKHNHVVRAAGPVLLLYGVLGDTNMFVEMRMARAHAKGFPGNDRLLTARVAVHRL